jgi:hypothetical protein
MTTSNAADSRRRAMNSKSRGTSAPIKPRRGQAPAVFRACALAAAIFIVPWSGGCSTATYNGVGAGTITERTSRLPVLPAPRLSLDEIVTLARQGVAADALIARIRAAGAYYRLSAADVISLRERGVPTPVIDHMLASEREFLVGGSGNTGGKDAERPSNKRPQPVIRALYHGV